MYRMILVDDEPWTLLGLSTLLSWEEEGFVIDASCTDPEEALEQILRNPPNVVFTDIRMPGLSGLELMRRAREHGVDAEFVLISAHSDFRLAQEAIRLGAFDYVLKPFDREEIRALAVRLCDHLAEKDGTGAVTSLQQKRRMAEWCRKHRGGSCLAALVPSGQAEGLTCEGSACFQLAGMDGYDTLLIHTPDRVPALPDHLRIGISRSMTHFDELNRLLAEARDSLELHFRYSSNAQVADIQQFIIASHAEEVTLAALSQRFFLSEKYICELFKRHAGTTVVTFLISVRMLRAIRLMGQEDLTLQEIASRVGYPNYGYFGRVFKQVMGMAPDQFRRTGAAHDASLGSAGITSRTAV